MLLLALVALGSIFFCASLKLILSAQKVVATKARLDICAVRLATSRERFLREISTTNEYVKVSVYTVYAARAAVVLSGGALLAAERLAVQANQIASLWQEGQTVLQQGREATLFNCEKTPFSDQRILCYANPPILKQGLQRTRALFPDIKDVYEWKRKNLGWVECRLVDKPTVSTRLKLNGDLRLKADDYSDVYKK